MEKNAKRPNSRQAGKQTTRREFIGKSTAAGAALATGTALFGGQPPAFAQSREFHYVQWSSFIPDADVEVKRQAEEFTKASGVKVTVEFINQNDMPPRVTAAIESGSGADLFLMINNQPHLFASGIADSTALVDEIHGSELYSWASGATVVDGVSRGVPNFSVGNAIVYRKDIFEEAGIAKPPDTWEEYLEVGTKLKNINMPVGQSLGHTFGDAPTFAYPMMWAFGGMEVDESGKKVIVDSPETHQALEFLAEFWNAACDPSGFAWDDTGNNRAFLGQAIGATLNGASIYFVARRNPDKYPGFADKLDHFLNPKGPAGRFHTMGPFTLCTMNHSKQKDAVADYIRFVQQEENFEKFMVINNGYVNGLVPKWEAHEMWESDPAITIYRDIASYGRHAGHAGPWSREASEANEKYIIVDMCARAARGEDVKKVAAWAQKELENVYS